MRERTQKSAPAPIVSTSSPAMTLARESRARSFAVDRGAIGGYALSHEAGDALGSRGNFRFDDRVRRS
jgi:hypothetical protein